MKKLLILGSGAGGTIVAAKMAKSLGEDWKITVIDRDWKHHYQAGWLFVPFGVYSMADCMKPKTDFIPEGVTFVQDTILGIDPNKKQVKTEKGEYDYDWLVIGTGCRIMPDEIEGMMDDWGGGGSIHDFYTPSGAQALQKKLKYYKKGKVVLNIAEMPIKCPVAPLEFVYLADWFFTVNGVRKDIEIELVTPLTGAFTKPVAAGILGKICDQKNIKITPNFALGGVDGERKVISSYDGTEVNYDMLVSIPPNFGSQVMIDSGISDPMGYIPVDKHTLQPKDRPNVWVLGDGTNVPTSKAGAVAHFQADILEENIMAYINGEAQHARSDGHAL